MTKLLIISILALAAACGSKPAPVTPANKTDATKKAADGAMGGTGYGGGSAKPPIAPGDPCAM